MVKQIFVNLPVKDLNKTIEFFAKLGFKFNPKFTDKNATCMIVGENIFAMLLVEKLFKTFIKKEIADAHKTTESIIGITAESRNEVDNLLKKAMSAGAKPANNPYDHGWVYGASFHDLDGHIWEVFYMDESKMPEEMKSKDNKNEPPWAKAQGIIQRK